MENWLDPELIKTQETVDSWRDAAKKSGELLVNKGYVKADYIDKMIETVEEFGMYIVIVPGVALFHARPDESVHKTGLSLLTIKGGVEFGVEDKDPVYLAFSLAAKDKESHLGMMQSLARVLRKEGSVEKLAKAKDPETLLTMINQLSKEA